MSDVPALRLIPAEQLDDEHLRRELAETHRLERAFARRCVPAQLTVLRDRLVELDNEYLRRFPHATARWPWRRDHIDA